MLSSDNTERIETEKRRRKNAVFDIAICSCIGLAGLFAFLILRTWLVDAGEQNKYAKAAEEVVTESSDGTSQVDFSALAEQSGAEAWIHVDGTAIDYPLVQGTDNSFYIDHDAYGNNSKAGAIFINSGNAADLSDPKTIIFGHNQANGTMFSDLNQFRKKEFGTSHDTMTITVSNGTVRTYKLLYYLYVQPEYRNIYVTFDNEDVSATAERLAKDAKVVYADYTGGKLVCLSTCRYHTKRSAVVWELVNSTDGDISSRAKESAVHGIGESEIN